MRKLNDQKHCGWCGSTRTYDGDWKSTCEGCDYTYYENPKPCAAAVVVSDGRVLLVERSIEPKKGEYDLPGGFIDMDDSTAEDAIYRELYEELGLTKEMLGDYSYIGSRTVDYPWGDTDLHTLTFYYRFDVEDLESKVELDTEENSQFALVEPNSDGFTFAWPTDIEIINEAMGIGNV